MFGDVSIKVYDEDGDGSMDFLGMVIIPLSHINNGEREWFALKTEDGILVSGVTTLSLELGTRARARFTYLLGNTSQPGGGACVSGADAL